MELFFDTETTGMLSGKKTADDPDQAGVIQLGFILSDATRIYHEANMMIMCGDKTMNPYAFDAHGITIKESNYGGLSEIEVFNIFQRFLEFKPRLVAHNFSFDYKFIVAMYLKHYGENYTDKLQEFNALESTCTMKESTVHCGLVNVKGHAKWPKLSELYFILFNEPFAGAHSALGDCHATRRCFYKLQELGVI